MGGWIEKFHCDKEIRGLEIGLEACSDDDCRRYLRKIISTWICKKIVEKLDSNGV